MEISPQGDTFESRGIRVVFPAGSVGAQQRFDAERVTLPRDPINGNQRLVSEVYDVWSTQTRFGRPVEVRLRFDRKLLPEGAAPGQIYPAISSGDLYERLPAKTVDLENQVITFQLDRLTALANADAANDGVGSYLAVVVDLSAFHRYKISEQGDYTIWIPSAYKSRFDAPNPYGPTDDFSLQVVVLEEDLRKLKGAMTADGFRMPEHIDLYIVPLRSGVAGMATAGKNIYLSFDSIASDHSRHTLAHELFHLVQQNSFTDFETDPAEESQRRWLMESTAEWMAYHLVPNSSAVGSRVRDLPSDFCYHPLVRHEDISGTDVPPQYLSMVFWAYLDTLYDVPALLRRIYRERGRTSPASEPSASGVGFYLDHLLSQTPDGTGRRRALDEVYVDFLLHFSIYKDFEPVASHLDPKRFGGPNDIRMPRDRTEEWTLPDGLAERRILRKSGTFGDKSYQIVQAILLRRGSLAEEKGDLELDFRVTGFGKGGADAGRLVVFPYKGDPNTGREELGQAMFGGEGTSVRIPHWERFDSAFIWLVDLSPPEDDTLTLTARFRPDAPEGKPAPPEEARPSPFLGTWKGTVTLTNSSKKIPPDRATVPALWTISQAPQGRLRFVGGVTAPGGSWPVNFDFVIDPRGNSLRLEEETVHADGKYVYKTTRFTAQIELVGKDRLTGRGHLTATDLMDEDVTGEWEYSFERQ